MTPPTPLRRTLRSALGVLPLIGVAACGGLTDERPRRPVAATVAPVPTQADAETGGTTIGTGKVKLAMVLPLSGPGQSAAAARSLRNAAELAISEFQGPDLTIQVYDDAGTADGARVAAETAVSEGAELILGPLFAPSVAAAGPVAKAAGRPVIAFSTDASVASRGVYLLSFTAGPEVERVIGHAAETGRRSIVALIPDTVYGSVVEGAFREAAARHGVRVLAIEHYAPGQPGPAVARLASLVTGSAAQANAILIPDSGEGLSAAAAALKAAGYDPTRVKPLGTGVWNDPRTAGIAGLQGGWYAAPEQAGYRAFAARYAARYGSEPSRIATLAYDAVSLAAALVRTQGSQRFSTEVLENPSGFAGADGTFRFRPDGTNDRTLAVMEIGQGRTEVVSPAPHILSSGS